MLIGNVSGCTSDGHMKYDACAGTEAAGLICIAVVLTYNFARGTVEAIAANNRRYERWSQTPDGSGLVQSSANQHDIAAAVDRVVAGTLVIERSAIHRDSSGLVHATLVVDPETPAKREVSFAIDVGVDCARGELEAYQIRSYNRANGKGQNVRTEYAGIVKRTRPGPPLDAAVETVCRVVGGVSADQ